MQTAFLFYSLTSWVVLGCSGRTIGAKDSVLGICEQQKSSCEQGCAKHKEADERRIFSSSAVTLIVVLLPGHFFLPFAFGNRLASPFSLWPRSVYLTKSLHDHLFFAEERVLGEERTRWLRMIPSL